MPDYSKGKIYKLCGAGKIYIGSTIQHLSKRHWSHKCAKINTVHEIIADPNNQITLIELYPCSCKEELLARERYHIENTECVNKIRRPISSEEEKNQYQKVYRRTPKYKEYQKALRQTPEHKEYQKAYKQTPDYKAYQKTYNKAYRERKKAEKLALQQN
jgi:hypothetical protein